MSIDSVEDEQARAGLEEIKTLRTRRGQIAGEVGLVEVVDLEVRLPRVPPLCMSQLRVRLGLYCP